MEHEWQTAFDPQPMLAFLQDRGRTSERKLRLFAVACSRRVWDWIDALGQTAVDTAERYADGLARPEEMRAARLACQGTGGQSAWYAATTNPAIAARNAARSAQAGVANNAQLCSVAAELTAQAKLVREIFGDPFRLLSVDPSWFTPTVTDLAKAIYENRAFDGMLELADALQEAGCASEDVLKHLREPGPHVRGCWALDLILGKK